MTLVQVAIVVVACFLSTVLIVVSLVSNLERMISKYHRQELETINELKKSLENKGCYADQPVIFSELLIQSDGTKLRAYRSNEHAADGEAKKDDGTGKISDENV